MRLAISLAVLCMVACAAPSRQLTSRVAEDPIVLPRGMASLSVRPSIGYYMPGGDVERNVSIRNLRIGLTDRLESVDLFSLRYRLLDDRPVDGRPAAPLSVAILAGLRGFGFSSVEGVILLPMLSLQALKHVGDRWALSFTTTTAGRWTEKASSIGASRRHYRWESADFRWLRQLTAHVAFGGDLGIYQAHDCFGVCAWKSRGMWGSFILALRPAPWLTINLRPSTGVTWGATARPDLDPNAPLPPRRPGSRYVAGSVALVFFW
jgi:hypothetical protein